ncbi:unnamed protein product [Echinostoma caproni]|uniref:MFS domain-containing protein n=1 Tax=Echinostoma caproni TaxID=27848 RepID=A0A183AG89_9TREM|nr:unnamed protein product [Echinostoma caproni]
MCVLLILWTVLMCTFPHLALLSGPVARALYAIWVSVMFFCVSGVLVLAPSATQILFGPKNMAINYGIMFTALILGSVLAALITTVRVRGEWTILFAAISMTCVLALLVVVWILDAKAPRQLQFINLFAKLRATWCARHCCCPKCCYRLPQLEAEIQVSRL